MELMMTEYNSETGQMELVRWVWNVKLEDIVQAEPEYSAEALAERAAKISVDQ